MPQIVAVRAKNDSNRDTITVVLSQDAVCLGPDGEPWAGVSLNAQKARSLAERLLDLANELDVPQKIDPSVIPISCNSHRFWFCTMVLLRHTMRILWLWILRHGFLLSYKSSASTECDKKL